MYEIIASGGLFMWPLLIGSAVTVGIGLERALYFWRLKALGQSRRQQLESALVTNDFKAAQTLVSTDGPGAFIARAALENWESDLETVDAAMSVRASEQQPELNRYLGFLETIVTAAPLVGLLGTITGMMGVFRAVAAKLGSDPHANTTGITAGIGEALIATATGILVAVLALFIHNLCQSAADAHMTDAEQTAESVRLAHLKKSHR